MRVNGRLPPGCSSPRSAPSLENSDPVISACPTPTPAVFIIHDNSLFAVESFPLLSRLLRYKEACRTQTKADSMRKA